MTASNNSGIESEHRWRDIWAASISSPATQAEHSRFDTVELLVASMLHRSSSGNREVGLNCALHEADVSLNSLIHIVDYGSSLKACDWMGNFMDIRFSPLVSYNQLAGLGSVPRPWDLMEESYSRSILGEEISLLAEVQSPEPCIYLGV